MDEMSPRPVLTVVRLDRCPICRAVSYLAALVVLPLWMLTCPSGQEVAANVRGWLELACQLLN
jgi:hypothetical protein